MSDNELAFLSLVVTVIFLLSVIYMAFKSIND